MTGADGLRLIHSPGENDPAVAMHETMKRTAAAIKQVGASTLEHTTVDSEGNDWDQKFWDPQTRKVKKLRYRAIAVFPDGHTVEGTSDEFDATQMIYLPDPALRAQACERLLAHWKPQDKRFEIVVKRFKIVDEETPLGVVNVSEGTKWACPFSHMVVGKSYPSLEVDRVHNLVIKQFEDLVRADRPLTFTEPIVGSRYGRERVTYRYPRRAEIRAELAGKDLACHCELDEVCHADVLIMVANGAQ